MNLLVEIGCEEIPDSMLAGALDHLKNALDVVLDAHQLGEAEIRTDATPRRLVIRAEGILERQPDSEERVWGPAAKAPEAAVAGFAKKRGVDVAQLEVQSDGKADKYSYLRKVKGRETIDILSEALPGLILKTPFPKTMLWPGKGGARFVRPVRWIVALFGERVVPFEIAGVQSGNESSGHRKLGARRFPVTFANYEAKLRENFVIVSAEERKARIRTVPVKYKCDNPLLKTLVNLTEWPTPITGTFDSAFLDLPKEVLSTVMRYHQKYFSVETDDGKLAPQFVAVTNTDGDPEGLIRHGNERVLKARFNDARFFWDTDNRRTLADRVADLAHVTFQAKLGTYLEKTDRMTELAFLLVHYAQNPGKTPNEADLKEARIRYSFGPEKEEFYPVRAARLSKADLTTELVKEFTELQGVIGGLYARAQGEAEPVALAVYEHYKPLSMEDSIPSSFAGQIVSIADKLDTLRGCFRVGLVPSGSKDPFALRRAAQGIVKILVEGRLRLPVKTLLGGDKQLEEFLLDRIRYYFRDLRGYAYDEISAVLAAGWDDLSDAEERLRALKQVRPTADFEPLAAGFKRISNILKQQDFNGDAKTVQPTLLEGGAELELYKAYLDTRIALGTQSSYAQKLQLIASLRPHIDQFFDKVLVNATDPAIRKNRLTLLACMLSEFSTIANFAEIVTSGTTNTNQESK
jgi:glycyl-tRNA synthetase beta chain